MRWMNWRIIVGSLLLIYGVVGILTQTGIIGENNNILTVLFSGTLLAAGLAFLYILAKNAQNWWAAIPGIVLTDLGLLSLVSSYFPKIADKLGGGFLLAGIGLAFWIIYFLNTQRWWAIIPGGVLFTLALVATIEDGFGISSGAILFIGLALTFGVLAVIPVNRKRMTWPLYPASGCILVAMIISLAETSLLSYIWPIGLIMAGIIVLVRSFSGHIKNER